MTKWFTTRSLYVIFIVIFLVQLHSLILFQLDLKVKIDTWWGQQCGKSVSYLIYLHIFPSSLPNMGRLICTYIMYTVHPYVYTTNASVFKYVRLCVLGILWLFFSSASFLSRCCLLSLASLSLVPEWLLRRAPSESLSSSCQGPRCPCAPQALSHTAWETSAFSQPLRTQKGSVIWQTHTHKTPKRPMCIAVFLTTAAEDI